MQISCISNKVTRIHKATTAENDTSLCRPFWFSSRSTWLKLQTTKFVPVTEPALLPGSYTEAGEVSFRAAIKEIIANAVSSDDLLGSN